MLDLQLVHMSEENFKLWGHWWSRKKTRTEEKYDEACHELQACGVDIETLREEWAEQVQDVTRKAPSLSR